MTKKSQHNHPHKGHRERLKNRFLNESLDSFEDHQVLELLLFQAIPRLDTNPIAHLLIKRFGSLSAVLEADPHDLESVEGVGPSAAVFLSMIPQITRRYFLDRVRHSRKPLTTSEAAAEYLIPLMAGRAEEVFYVICLDSQLRVLYPALVSEGTVKDAVVHPRHVVEAALRHKAASVILAHNHPGGSMNPSGHDHKLTVRLVQALGNIDIKVVDHVIVAGDQIYSFAREGVMPVFNLAK
ncbi:MAG: DNA repair protein RadC [Nitrospirae bacterium]|nr:MAG: DNA repair protein RadC [Nitrospirota bacterium]